MVLVQVDYYPELDVTGGVAPLKVGNTQFVVKGPANRRNEVDSEEWQKIKKLPAISMRLDKGILRLVGGGQIIQPTPTPSQPTIPPQPATTPEVPPPPIPEPSPEPQPIQQALFTSSVTEVAPIETTSTRKKRGATTDEATNS